MGNIYQDQQGNYHWVYEMNLYSNPTIMLMLVKIFGGIFLGMWLFLTIIDAVNGKFSMDSFLSTGKIILIIAVVFAVLVPISYLIYAALMGGKYCVLFEMSPLGVKHTQLPKQFKKAQAIGILGVLIGGATGNLATMGLGLHNATMNSRYSAFADVKTIEVDRKNHVIKLNEPLNYNQVYAEDVDFDFVLSYIQWGINQAQGRQVSG